MSESSPAPTRPVSETQLMADVHKLIFANSDSSTWDHLGNHHGSLADGTTSGGGSSRRKHAAIHNSPPTTYADSIELIDLPVGLALLFHAAHANQTTTQTSHLLGLLHTLSLPPPPVDPCHRLYDMQKVWDAKRQASLDAINHRLFEEEMKDCTFQPQVSAYAKGLGFKGESFYAKAVEWKEKSIQRKLLKAQKADLEADTDVLKPWKMNERSKQIVERKMKREQREQEGGGMESPSRRDGEEGSLSPYNRSRVRHTPKAEVHSFEPITNSANQRSLYLVGGAQTSTAGNAEDEDPNAPHIDDGASNQGGRAMTTASHIVQRLQEDAKAREERAELRKKHYEMIQKQRLYDPETGQPLFEPNAMATKAIGKERVAFDHLSPEDRADLLKRLQKVGMSHLIAAAKKKQNRAARPIDEIVATMADRTTQAAHHIEKIKRDDKKHEEGWFTPKVNPTSLKMAEGKTKIHELPLPTPKVADNSSKHPEPTKPAPSSAKKMNGMVERSEEWVKHHQLLLERKREKQRAAELDGCSFKPERAVTKSKNQNFENDLVMAAEVRMRYDLEMYRSVSKEIDGVDVTKGGLRSVQRTGSTASQPAASQQPFRSQSHLRPVHSHALHPRSIDPYSEVLYRGPSEAPTEMTSPGPKEKNVRGGAPAVSPAAGHVSRPELQLRSNPAWSQVAAGGQSPQPAAPTAATIRGRDADDALMAALAAVDEEVQDSAQRQRAASNVGGKAGMDDSLEGNMRELQQLLQSWKSLEQETDSILDQIAL